jgi:hypothetical protein
VRAAALASDPRAIARFGQRATMPEKRRNELDPEIVAFVDPRYGGTPFRAAQEIIP